jgi:predicted transcriptional regulator of viral defense system
MRQSKYILTLKPLLEVPLFTAKDAESIGVPRHALAYYVKTGVLERLYPGAYRSVDYEPRVDFPWEHMAWAVASIPEGVICLISALCIYDLTDQIMREAWIAIPNRAYASKRPDTRIIRMRNIDLGKTKMTLGEHQVKIFDRERCVVDAFRYLSHEIAIKALQRYLRDKKHKPDLKKLQEYARILRVKLTPYILAYTT